jgi:hypothetical protein
VSEARIDRLEEDMHEIRAVLGRLEPMINRIEATLPLVRNGLHLPGRQAYEMVNLVPELTGLLLLVRRQTNYRVRDPIGEGEGGALGGKSPEYAPRRRVEQAITQTVLDSDPARQW